MPAARRKTSQRRAAEPDPLEDDNAEVAGQYEHGDPLDGNIGMVLPPRGGTYAPTDVLLAIRPLQFPVLVDEGTANERDAYECYVVEVVDEDDEGAPGYKDHGKLAIPWQHVMAELDKATDEAPWVVGTIVKKSKAYFINPPSPSQVMTVRNALRRFMDDRRRRSAS